MSDPLTIKICGIKTEAILDAAIDAGADMVGFMHFPRSPRHLELDDIGELISLARGRAETCVVLVNPGPDGNHVNNANMYTPPDGTSPISMALS